jgi:putative transposase
VEANPETEATMASPVVDQQLVAELVARAVGQGVSVTGEGGLPQQLTKLVPEASLEGQMDARLGYAKHDPAGRDGGNSRNGERSMTVLTQVGPVEIAVPRDLDASFQPQMARNASGAWTASTPIVLSLSARGLTTGEGLCAHLAEVYGATVSKETISKITDRVMDSMGEWQSRPLDPGRFTPPFSSTPLWSRYATGRWPPPDLHRDRRHARRRKGCAGLVACSALRWVSSHSGK